MPCTYILYSATTDKPYTGSSHQDNALSRIAAHNSGKTRSTKAGRPWVLISEQYYETYKGARQQEIFLKSGKGREHVKELLAKLRSA